MSVTRIAAGLTLTLAVPLAHAAEGGAASSPSWTSLLPPLLAIAVALWTRQVIPALIVGVAVGSVLHYGFFAGLLRTLDHYTVNALTDADHVKIVLFSILLGGMVGIISRSGGLRGLVDALAPYATTARRGQIVTWALGLAVFFDDYANTLIVGNTMRPVTDRLRISREKLAYLVDSTAAPVASIFLVSTWIGYQASLIGDATAGLGITTSGYGLFLESLPYNFYPILALALGLIVTTTGRDIGPMLAAERRAAGGKLLADGAVPLSEFDGEELTPREDRPKRWINAVVPVLTVLLITFGWLWSSGRSALRASGDPAGSDGLFTLGVRGLGKVFGEGASYDALLYASFAACVVAIVMALAQRILPLRDALAAWLAGMKSMIAAFVVLTLAWSISAVCSDLDTAGFLVSQLSDSLAPQLLPAIVFILAAFTAFATGSAWGTMAILIPLSVPTAYGLAQDAALADGSVHSILLGSISAVLAGAIFGDHCSPISDTTVMSSMAAGCDHVDHVRTQLPYAVLVAAVSLVAGYLPVGYGMPAPLGMLGGAIALFATMRWLGRRAVA